MRLSILCGVLAVALSGCDFAVDLGITGKVDGGPAAANTELPDGGAGATDGGSDATADVDVDPSLTVTCGTAGVQPGSPWPMEARCTTRQAQTKQIAAQSASVKWAYDAGATSTQCPSCVTLSGPSIAADGTLYVTGGKQLLAVHPDGTLAWSAPLTSGALALSSYGAPSIGVDGSIYLGASLMPGSGPVTTGAALAFTPGGTKKWSYDAPVFRAPSIASDGTMYFPGYDGKVYAIRSDGTLAWAFATAGNIAATPAIGPGGIIYVGSADGALYAISPDGLKLWSYASGDPIRRPVVVAPDGTLYASGSKLLAISPGGALLWTFSPPTGVPTGVAIANDGSLRVVADHLFALTTAGTTKWGFVGGGPSNGAASVDGADTALFTTGQLGDAYGRLVAVDAAGAEKWIMTLPEGAANPPAIGADGTVYITVGTKLYAVGP